MLLGIGFHQNDNFQSVKWDLIMVTIMGLKRALSKIDFKGAFAMDQTSPNFKECQTKHLEIDVSLGISVKFHFLRLYNGVMNDQILGCKSARYNGLFETSVK